MDDSKPERCPCCGAPARIVGDDTVWLHTSALPPDVREALCAAVQYVKEGVEDGAATYSGDRDPGEVGLSFIDVYAIAVRRLVTFYRITPDELDDESGTFPAWLAQQEADHE